MNQYWNLSMKYRIQTSTNDLGFSLYILGQYLSLNCKFSVTNFIQLVSPQPVDQFSQTKLY